MGFGKYIKEMQEKAQAQEALFNDPARRNELIGYDPIKNPLGFLTLGGIEKFEQRFNERRKKVIGEASALALKEQEAKRTSFAGVNTQMQNERRKLLGI